ERRRRRRFTGRRWLRHRFSDDQHGRAGGDHNHDDRYYTKQQIDRRTMFAVVDEDGTLRRSSDGVTSAQIATATHVGDYLVTFPRNVDGCGFVASPTSAIETN